ncbi:hypothetical protein BJP40_02775 [Streptomyces sp. CC53]|uniref:sugar ABC transporter substrate-binding protein n=1 Tax=unclassified Streptomyces TaxID=2593676 RepID=UPI0008DC978C|nr:MULTISPECIES: extracellular solute-binding protein [unclassified Streptomyces]OII63523.1 hypothetical protein BJP40_02775 [Streptomyces sp. CC53]
MSTSRTRRTARSRGPLRTALALALPLAALVSCTGGGTAAVPTVEAGSGKGTIRVWAHQGQKSEDAALQAAVAAFNRAQKDVKAELKLIPGNDYTKTVTATDPASLPDVMEFDGPTMANFVHNGKLAPLDPYVSVETVANATDAVKAQGTIGDHLYGLAMYDSGLGVYGNKKVLEAAGVDYPKGVGDAWTAEEFTAALKALKAVDPDGDGKVLDVSENYGLATEWGTYGFSPVVWSAGGALLEDGRAAGALDGPEAVSALTTVQSWKPYVDPNTDGNAFAKGRVALSWVGHWQYPAYSAALGDDLTVLPLPDFGHGTKTGQGSWAWGIGAASKNGKAAGAFLDFLLDDESVGAMTKANGAPPATHTALAESELYRKGGPLQVFADQLAMPCGTRAAGPSCVAVTRPVTAGYPVVTSEFGKALYAVYGGADPETALSKAARAIDRDFADNDGYPLG